MPGLTTSGPPVSAWPTVSGRLLGPAPYDVESLGGYLDLGGCRDVRAR